MTPRGSWLIRRVFECEEGPLARWWLGPDWPEEKAFGEPEDCQSFPTRIAAEAEYRVMFGSMRGVTAQRLRDAYLEVVG
jgi:hypothetical protein